MRHPDWVARLTAVIDAARSRPFSYGLHDCAFFGAACTEAVTGQHFPMPHTGRLSAARLVNRHGGLAALITERLGPPATGTPRRGDVCLVPTEDGDGIGVVWGASIAVPGERGLEFLPLQAAIQHWRT